MVEDSTTNKNNCQSSSQGYLETHSRRGGGLRRRSTSKQKLRSPELFVNANFLPSSSETAAELALIVGTTAYVLLVLYLWSGVSCVQQSLSNRAVQPSHKRTTRIRHHHHGVSPQLRVCLRTMAMSPFTAGWMMAKEPAKFVFDLLKPTISFAPEHFYYSRGNVSWDYVRGDSKGTKVFAVAPIKTTKMATVSRRRNILKRITTTATMVPRRNTPNNGESSKKPTGRKANNNNNNNNNGKSSPCFFATSRATTIHRQPPRQTRTRRRQKRMGS